MNKKSEGIFEIKEVSPTILTLIPLDSNDETFEVNGDQKQFENIHEGNILIGQLTREKQWKIEHVIRLFPSQARRWVKDSVAQKLPIG